MIFLVIAIWQLGGGLLFNIKLPINFNSPYKALNIQDFWRRWHITLGRFLRDYIYIPLGGNKKGELKTYINLITTFIIGGIWHGAGYTFIIWGFLHGIALTIHRFWQKLNLKMNKFLAWFITFNFVNIAWVFFRANDISSAFRILKAMFGFGDFELSLKFLEKISMWSNIALYKYLPYKKIQNVDESSLIYSLFFILIILFFRNSMFYLDKKISLKMIIFASLIFAYSIINSFFTSSQVFLYFNF